MARGHEDHQPGRLLRRDRRREPLELLADVLVDPARLITLIEAHDERQQVIFGQFAACQFLPRGLGGVKFPLLGGFGPIRVLHGPERAAFLRLDACMFAFFGEERVILHGFGGDFPGFGDHFRLRGVLLAVDAYPGLIEQGLRVLFLTFRTLAHLQRARAGRNHWSISSNSPSRSPGAS